MRLLLGHAVLLMCLVVPGGEASPLVGRRLQHLWCQNSCLAPSTHQTTTGNSIDSTATDATPSVPSKEEDVDGEDGPSSKKDSLLLDSNPSHYRTHVVEKGKEEEANDGTVWGAIRAFRQRSFDVVALPRVKKRQNGPPRSSRRPKQSKVKPQQPSGTRFDLRPPSSERIAQWFAPATEVGLWSSRQNKKKRRKQMGLFNHDSVGMTNPVLHIAVDNHHSNSNGGFDVEASTSTSTSTWELEDSWIPASSVSTTTTTQQPQQQASPSRTVRSSEEAEANHWARVLQYKLQTPPQDASREAAERAWFPAGSSNSNSNKWRQCRYRRRVGRGQACYERVREAALGWQFNHTNAQDASPKGILAVHSKPQQPSQHSKQQSNCFSLDDHASQQVQPLWSGPHTGASRRLVTYTTTGFKTKWLPKLYTMNPVMVVYDLLDQRGPGTTYTSTAYATLKGHLLRGEERVTVAFRDDTGFVDVEILSYSKPAASVRAKCIWPLIGNMQQTFFQHQMDFLERVALPPKPLPPPLKGSPTTPPPATALP